MKNKLGQLLMMGLEGPELTESEEHFIIQHNIGGVVLFDRNLESPQQLHALIHNIQELRHKMPDKAPLFVGIDMEGGRVHRLKPPFTQWPPLKKIGDIDSTSVAFRYATAMGEELKAIGINVNFAPCVDVLTNPDNQLIGDRSLSSDSEKVTLLSSALVRGYIKSGIIPCAKHFPGHGNTVVDSHEDLPVDETSLDTLKEREFPPFKKAFRARLDLLMTAHIKFPQIDPENPATLSRTFLQDILRKELGYRNLVITDDLDMKALTKYYSVEEIPVLALEAGANILLYCNEPDHPAIALQAIEKALKDKRLSAQMIDDTHHSVLKLKADKIKQVGPLPLADANELVGCEEHKEIADHVARGEAPPEEINGAS